MACRENLSVRIGWGAKQFEARIDEFSTGSTMEDFVERGCAAVKARRPAEAVEWFEKALQEDPGDGLVMAWLGQCLCTIGRRDEGCARLRAGGQALLEEFGETKEMEHVFEVVGQLQQWSDFSGAVELGEAALRIAPENFRGWQQLAASYAQLNRKADAIAAGRRALEISPGNAMMQVFLGSLEADAGESESAKIRLEQVLRQNVNPREGFRAHKELARIYDKLGDYARVFPHLRAATKLAALVPEYGRQDVSLLPRLLKANSEGFDRELLGRWSGTSFTDGRPAPTFLIGFFRSGTTLTQEVLDAHPDVFVADEADFVWAMQRELHDMDKSQASVPDKLRKLDRAGIEHLRHFYWERVAGRFGDGMRSQHFVDKFTLNTVDVGLINCVFPDAKVIFVMRDPRDVCLSCIMQLMVPSPATVHLLGWEATVRFYAQIMQWWRHIKPLLTVGVMEFRYEDAVTQFEPTFRRIFEFLGLAWDPAVADFHQRAAKKYIATPSRSQVAQPLYASSMARWRAYETEFKGVAEHLAPFVTAFGYEP